MASSSGCSSPARATAALLTASGLPGRPCTAPTSASSRVSSVPARASSASLACCATARAPSCAALFTSWSSRVCASESACLSRWASESSFATAATASETNAGASSSPAAFSRSNRLNRPKSLGSAPARNEAGSKVPASNGEGPLPLSPMAPSAREMPCTERLGAIKPPARSEPLVKSTAAGALFSASMSSPALGAPGTGLSSGPREGRPWAK